MPKHRAFDISIMRAIDKRGLHWPTAGEVGPESNPGCNREYQDLRGLSLEDFGRIALLEDQLLGRLEAARIQEEEYSTILDELYDDDEGLFGLDIGIASAVVALSAVGCIPISSCNGGAYGGSHPEAYPLVAFFAKARHVGLLTKCAEEANVGLEIGHSGSLVLYSDSIRNMRAFADALAGRSGQP